MKTTDDFLQNKRVPSATEGEFTKYILYDGAKMAMNEFASQMILENEKKWIKRLEALMSDIERFRNNNRIDANSKESFRMAIEHIRRYKDYEI